MAFLCPSDIKYTQCSISDTFRNGQELTDVFMDLVSGDLEVDDIDEITCVKWNHEYWVIHGNRRLFLYQKLEQAGLINQIDVNVKPFIPQFFFKRYTTKNNGVSVWCRNNPDLSHELNDILRDHGEEIESDSSESETSYSETSEDEWQYDSDSDSDYYNNYY